MNNEKVLLAYNLSSDEKEGLKEAGYNLRIINENNSGGTLLEIIEGKTIAHSGKNLKDIKMIIYSGFGIDDELKEVITFIRKNIVFGSIMAVTTKTNLKWSFDYLMEHLLEEKDENIEIEKERRKDLKNKGAKDE